MNKSDSVVIIPTYNEKENIENIINAVFALPVMFDVLIIDDNSLPTGLPPLSNGCRSNGTAACTC